MVSLRLAWLPMLYVAGGLGLAVAFGLPPAGVRRWILLDTFLVGLSEAPMFRGVVPVLLALPNALYGLWLMRRIGQTHAQADT